MLVPLSWLKEYVEIDIPPEELGEMLTMAGLELEALHYRGKEIDNIIVARITEVRKHPNADRLSLCEVTDGTNSYNIVCGADNMKANDVVALAPIGAKLPPTEKFPDGLKIKKTKIRGEVSEGMLCAENELGLSDQSEGIMILSDNLSLGAKLVDELSLDEVVFEIAVTPNRPDCLSILGIAREVGSILGKKLKTPDFKIKESKNDTSKLVNVDIKDPAGCPRYTCRVIEDVSIEPSPDWLKNRLEAAGIRSINNVVDITNFVLLELGQPLHAFDFDLLKEKKINIRFANNGELISTLDGQERKLTDKDIVICDADKPVALGGVMGGLNTEVNEKTKSVLLESAYFNPVTIRKTSKRTGLKS
ncbi:MAG: phenylalanine--tRNA ligase subunit beta, partial [Thermodesulfobacteriota bacterium]